MDELHGILTAYEMKSSLKNQSENPNDEEAVFINKLERGTEKYHGSKNPRTIL